MAKLDPVHRKALRSLIGRERDGTLYRVGASNLWIRECLGLTRYTARQVQALMRCLAQAGLVEAEWRTASGAVRGWTITPAGILALEPKRVRQ